MDQATYTILEVVSEELYFVYSKDSVDELPLIKTSVEFKPCIHPGQISKSEPSYLYLNENTHSGCEYNSFFETSFDDRFQDLGLQINEYEV